MTGRLEGKVAIVTGGARGMGEACCRSFIAEGAKVVFTDVLAEEGEALAAELGEGAVFVEGDVRSPACWDGIVSTAEQKFGRIDILLNNAGVMGPFLSTTELSEADYQHVCAINQHAVFLGMQAVIPSMIKNGRGSIINISSIAGLRAVRGFPNIAYVASKFAVRGMSKAAAVEFGNHGIRVNSVHPGLVMTKMLEAGGELDAEQDISVLHGIPLSRVGAPMEIASLVLFLASDESSYISGGEFVADGGLTAG